MWRDLKHVYRTAGAFALACPLLFLVPILPELAQHVVEWKLGMYRSFAEARAMEAHGARMGFGVVKILALIVAGYWTTRFFVWRDAARARTVDRVAIATFAPVVLFEIALSMLALFGHKAAAGALGVTEGLFTGVAVAANMVIGLLLAHWRATAPLGDPASGPLRSIRIMAPRLLPGLAFFLLAILPAMIVHYALGLGAIGRPPFVAATMLLVDSVFVGYLSAVMIGANVMIATRAAERHGDGASLSAVRATA